ncbi:hypothetical protein HPT29_011435 [Microvirga terrae]|uniref:Uncharacterized protein n=1 Tax=Microvirga terrae TaxID=2740529 RepID=A0ABY5S096_9HYPH|nr:hypothetical protein [Microvirga terrae]UVF21684.1 hypothetical protein HPT29_011435 [Microvirga terrae]
MVTSKWIGSARITGLPSVLILAAAFAAPAAQAGPCGAEIDRVQAAVDARIDATAGAGRTGAESTAATDHREPTPGSIATAEARLGDGASNEKALAALTQARAADQAGDGAACERALTAARAAIGR